MTPITARQWLRLSIFDTVIPIFSPPVSAILLPLSILRDYQIDLLLRVAAAMAEGYRRILVVLPTGGGKTVMASAMMESALAQVLRAQFIVHRKELIEQTSDTFTGQGIPHGFIASGRPIATQDELVTVAGVQTLVRRFTEMTPPALAIVDEAHHAIAASWDKTLSHYAGHDCFIVGLTATPQRLDGKGLSDHFDIMLEGPTTADLIEAGYLSPFDYYAPGVPDLKGVHTTAGDFNRGEIDSLMNEPKLIGDIVDHYRRLAEGMQGIVFAASRQHSRNIADAFNAAGISAAHVDGSMSDLQRADVVDGHRSGRLRIMCNVDLFGEGFDVPQVSYVGLARPTKSLTLHLQQVGRGLRVAEGKAATVICDHAGNAFRHGLPDEPRQWSLQGRAGRASAGSAAEDSFPIHQCEICFRVTPSSVRICPGCGSEFPIKTPAEVKKEGGELAKLERIKLREKKKEEERQCRTFDDFLNLGIERGYDKPQAWAQIRMSARSRRVT